MTHTNFLRRFSFAIAFCLLFNPALDAQVDVKSASETKSSKPITAVDFLDKAKAFRDQGMMDSAIIFAGEAEVIARKADDPQREAVAILFQGVTKHRQGSPMAAMEHYEKSRSLFLALKDTHHLALIAANIGNILNRKGKYEDALTHVLEGLELREAIGDTVGMVHSENSIGFIFTSMGEFEKGIEHARKAVSLARAIKDTIRLGNALSGLGVAYSSAGDYETGLKYYLQVMDMHPVPSFRTYSLGNIGKSYIELGEYEKAYPYLKEARALDSLQGKTGNLALNDHNFGEWFARQGKVREAMPFYQKAIDSSLKYGFMQVAEESYLSIYKMMEKKGNYQTALKYYIRYAEFRDSTASAATKAAAVELETSYKNQKQKVVILEQEAEIAALNQTNELQKANAARTGWLLAAALLALILVISWFIFGSRKRKLQMQATLQKKEQELRGSMELILNKNKLLHNLQEQLDAMEANKEMTYVDLATVIRNNVENDDDWEAFHLHFNQIHPQLLAGLKKQHPVLTQNDLRLCSLLRINMHTKEIAQILGISADSVKKAKIRLAKKLDLDSQRAMIQYVLDFKSSDSTTEA